MTDNRGYDSSFGTPPPYTQAPPQQQWPPLPLSQPGDAPPPYSPYPRQDLGQVANVVMVSRSAFHNGARFDDPSRPSIPPPAPGYQPNEVQRMAMSGAEVKLSDSVRR